MTTGGGGDRPAVGKTTVRSNVSPATATPAPTPLPIVEGQVTQYIHAGTGKPFSDKGRKTAGLLQILLGGFGAGRFYLGYPKIAILQTIVTWATCGAGLLWPIVDGVRMLEGRVPDAKGRPLRED